MRVAGGQEKWIDGAHGQHWNTGWKARAPSSDRKRNPALIRPLPLVNWTRQLSCQVINSLRKFSALSQARLILRSGSISNLRCVPNACWIHLSPSTLSLHWTIHLHNWAHPTSSPPLFPGSVLSWVISSLPTSIAFTHWTLCHFLNNDPGGKGTSAYLYFITESLPPTGLGDQVKERLMGWSGEREGGRGSTEEGLPTAMGTVGVAASSWLTEAQMSPSELNLGI